MKKTAIIIIGIFFGILFTTSFLEAANELSVRCSVSPSDRVVPGEIVTYTARVEGGRGVYAYSWNGSDARTSSSRIFETYFPQEGTKQMSLTVRSGEESKTTTCPTLYLSHEPLRGWCSSRTSARNESIETTWSVGVRGGSGNYDVTWTGSEGFEAYGSSVTKSYTSGGTKHARAYVRDRAGYELVLNCSAEIPEVYKLEREPLSFGCTYASHDPRTRYQSAWQGFYSDWLTRSGHNDPDEPTYFWHGSEGLSRYGSYVRMAYEDPGRKRATLESVSARGLLRVRSTCEAYVIDEKQLPSRTRSIARSYQQEVSRRGSNGSYVPANTPRSDSRPSSISPNTKPEQYEAYQRPQSSCFIQSATQNSSSQENDLQVFRDFRDSRLSQSEMGRSFTRWYYDMSESSSKSLENNPYAQAAAAALIHPLSLILPSL